jgi:ribosome-associated translation inhibitor RaiA
VRCLGLAVAALDPLRRVRPAALRDFRASRSAQPLMAARRAATTIEAMARSRFRPHRPLRTGSAGDPPSVTTLARGRIAEDDLGYAQTKLGRVLAASTRPVIAARAVLTRGRNPAVERPFTAAATVEVGGRLVRVHAVAGTMREAVDLLQARLRRQLAALSERDATRRRRSASSRKTR